MMKNIALFGTSALLAYGVSHLVGDQRLLRLYTQQSFSEFVQKEELSKKYEEFPHSLSRFLRMSRLNFDDEKKRASYLYLPKKKTQGFPGVCHGGFSYSICLTVANEYIKHFGLPQEIVKTYMKYTAPIRTEGVYMVQAHQENSDVKIEVQDQAGKSYAIFTATLSRPTSNVSVTEATAIS